MRRSSVWVALAVLVLFKVPSAFADPIAEWASPWRVELSPPGGSGNVNLSRGFGAGAQQDGQVTDLGFSFERMPSPAAFAKVFGQGFSDVGTIPPFLDSIGLAFVDFERAFRLQGSPAGWSVQMYGLLDGVLRTLNDDLKPQAGVAASVQISSFFDPATPLVQFAFDRDVFDGEGASVVQLFDTHVVLSDGDYLLRGNLTTLVSVEGSLFRSGTAVADFFGNEQGLIVFTVPTPLEPERSIIITSVYQSILHRSPTNEEFTSALAYLQAGGTQQGLRGRLLAKLVPVL